MSSPEQTQMVSAPKTQTKMVKIRAKSPIRIMKEGVEHVIQPGEVADVSDAEAKEFCDKKIDIGYKNTFGNRHPSDIKKEFVVRAERVK